MTVATETTMGATLLVRHPPVKWSHKPFGDTFEVVTRHDKKQSSRPQVPRIIHQTWKDEQIPDKWMKGHKAWLREHPGYWYVLWRDVDLEQLIQLAYPWAWETYVNLKYNIQRVDFGRMFVLHAYGGVYSDLDLSPKRSMQPLLDFFSNDSTPFEIALVEGPSGRAGLLLSNFLMFSVPHASWIMTYISYVVCESWRVLMPWYVRVLHRIKHYYVMMSTGPAAVSMVYKATVRHEGTNTRVMIIPAVYVNTTKIYQKPDPTEPEDPNLRFVQLEGRSWCNTSTRIAINAARAWDNRDYIIFPVFFITLIVTIILGVLYHRNRSVTFHSSTVGAPLDRQDVR